MLIKKYISGIIVLIVLHHSPLAWAENEYPASPPLATLPQQEPQPVQEQPMDTADQCEYPFSPEAPSPQQEPQPVQGQPADTVMPSAPEPLVEHIQTSPSDTLPQPEAGISKSGLVDRLHHEISWRLLSTATWLDSFFQDERVEKELNQSYIRFRYDVFHEERAEASYRPTVNVRLALPKLEKRAHLVISAESPETAASAPVPADIPGDRISKTDERNVTTAVHYILRDTEQQNSIVRTGAQFSHGSPVLFIAPRYRYFVPFTTWNFRFTQEAVWKTDTKWQVDTLFDLERQLPRGFFFRSSLGGTWFDGTNGYFYNLSFSLRHPFGLNNALDYAWINSYRTRPVYELTEMLFSVRYREKIWRDWLFFEVAPQLRFPRDRHFKGLPGVLFRFEIFFGKKA